VTCLVPPVANAPVIEFRLLLVLHICLGRPSGVMADSWAPFPDPPSPTSHLPRVRGLASQLAATRAVVASWRPAPAAAGRGSGSSGRSCSSAALAALQHDNGTAPAQSHPAVPVGGGARGGAATGTAPGRDAPFIPLTKDTAEDMPEYHLLGRSARARAWLSELWDPSGGPCPDGPPLNPTALAGGVAMERMVRFLHAAPAGPGEDTPSFLPGDEADGTGLGPALVVLTYMAVPVEAPPLGRWWTSAAEGNGVADDCVADHELSAGAVAAKAAALDGVHDASYDEDDEVVTLHIVTDVQRDLLRAAGLGPFTLPLTSRGIFHRRTGEMLSLASAAAPAESPMTRLLLSEHHRPMSDGSLLHTVTSFGVRPGGHIGIFSRSRSVVRPSVAASPPSFPPTDGVTALAGAMELLCGSHGLAYSPCQLGPLPAAAADGKAPAHLPLILTCDRSSVAATFRIRGLAAKALLAPVTPRAPPSSAAGVRDGRGHQQAGDEGVRKHSGRGRRRPVNLDALPSDAHRARIVRNRVSAARSNAGRRALRNAARASGAP